MARPPDLHVASRPKKPSDWSPRPIPQPGPERRTADPKTPTLRELSERERRDSLAVAPPVTWLDLVYTHADDGSPMGGAPYHIRFVDGSSLEGRLDANGRMHLAGLSPALAGTPVDVRFGEPSAEFHPLPVTPERNPDHRPAALARLTTPGAPAGAPAGGGHHGAGGAIGGAVVRAPDGPVHEVLEYLWTLVAGAYQQDPTSGEIVGQMIVAMIPVVGQVADVRDLSAYVYQLSKPGLTAELRKAAWIGLVLTGVALLLPEVGAAVAGVGRLALKGGPGVERLVLPLLRRVGRGNALKFLERELSAARVTAHASQAFERVAGHLRAFFEAVERTWLPVGDAVRQAARQALADLARVAEEARSAIRQVAAEIEAKVNGRRGRRTGRSSIRHRRRRRDVRRSRRGRAAWRTAVTSLSIFVGQTGSRKDSCMERITSTRQRLPSIGKVPHTRCDRPVRRASPSLSIPSRTPTRA